MPTENRQVAASLESQIVGILLRHPETLRDMDLEPEDFRNGAFGIVYETMRDIHSSVAVEPVSVAEAIEASTGRNFLPLIVSAHESVGARANLGHYVDRVREESRRRKAAEVLTQCRDALQTEGTGAIDNAISALMQISRPKATAECSIGEAASLAAARIDRLRNTDDLTGISTGFCQLDDILGGWQNADLHIIAGRPAMAKTALMLNFALAAGVPVGIFSAEQPREQIGLRVVAQDGGVDAVRLRTADVGDNHWRSIVASVARLETRSIRINDTPAPSITDVERQARKWIYDHGIRAVFVDYVQRLGARDRKMPRFERVGQVTMALKELARELDIPVIALAQVSRRVEDRLDKRPTLSDLKDSGEIEQEADIVVMLYRDEVYNQETDRRGILELNLAKNRHGPIGQCELKWQPAFMRFSDHYSTAEPDYDAAKWGG